VTVRAINALIEVHPYCVPSNGGLTGKGGHEKNNIYMSLMSVPKMDNIRVKLRAFPLPLSNEMWWPNFDMKLHAMTEMREKLQISKKVLTFI